MIVLAFLSSFCLLTTVTGSSYYVAAPDGAPCPRKTLNCHELSFYTNQSSVYFISNTVFYFLEGHHFLDQQNLVSIQDVRNLTLQGLGTMEAGPHETVMQSTVVIDCNGGFGFFDTHFVSIKAITITECNVQNGVPFANSLLILLSSNFLLQHVSVQNSTGYGLFIENSFNLTIEESSFYRNQYPTVNCTRSNCRGGNAFITFSDYLLTNDSVSNLTLNSKLNILNSNFSLSFGRQYKLGSGLMIEIKNTQYNYRVDINIDNVVAYGNSGSYGANNMLLSPVQKLIIELTSTAHVAYMEILSTLSI